LEGVADVYGAISAVDFFADQTEEGAEKITIGNFTSISMIFANVAHHIPGPLGEQKYEKKKACLVTLFE
jgi:hypothetical protein